MKKRQAESATVAVFHLHSFWHVGQEPREKQNTKYIQNYGKSIQI